MKKGFFKLTGFLSVFMFLLIITGCSTKGSGNEDGFDEIKKNGCIVIGIDDSFVPMGFKNDKGEIVGFDVDLAKEAAKKIGLKVDFQSIDWSMKESELKSKNIDLIWNGYTMTDERKDKVLFTNPYLQNRQVIITKVDSAIKTKKDLEGKKVAVQSGSSSLDAINKEPELVKTFDDGKPILFDTNNEALMDLDAGRTDAVVADEILARYYMKERGENKYKVLQDDFGKEEYAIGARKEDKKLVDSVNNALDEMKRDGTSAKISEKWFGTNIIN